MFRHSSRAISGKPEAPARRRRTSQSGYSFVELVITVGIILVATTWAMPSFLSYYRSARVRSGAQTLSAYLNEGRQMAIKTNTPVCMSYTTSTVQYRQSTCGGTTLYVAGLNSAASIRLPDNISLSSTASAIFGNLGNATTAATYTVTDTVSGRTLTVTVAASGRITIP
jgi:Tfp pilus assembly protein FimT